MLYKLPLTITTLSPVVFSENSGDNVMTASTDYVSGAIVRGALAALYIKNTKVENAEKDSDFFDCFLSGKLRFLPGYPLSTNGAIAAPLPLSLYTTKAKDCIIDLACANIQPSLKGVKGYGVVSPKGIKHVSVKKNLNLHMSRYGSEERIVGSSIDGNIYNYEYVEAGQLFEAAVVGKRQDLEHFAKVLANKAGISSSAGIYLGRSKRTQYGKCSIAIGNIVEASENITEKSSIYLYAYSDYLPMNSCFGTVQEAFTELLDELSSKLGSKVKLGKCFATVGEQEGFVAVWGLKRKVARSIKAGSIVELVKENGSWTAADMEVLKTFAEASFGRRTAEGFGYFKLWNPLQFNEKAVITEDNAKELRKPKTFSLAVQKTVTDVIGKIILERLQQIAWEDIEKRFKEGGLGKHALARLENILTENKDKPQLKTAVVDTVRDYSAFKVNLENAKLNNVSLYEIFSNEAPAPYVPVWNSRIVDKELKQMAEDISIKLPTADDNKIYYQFWLWYCRIARKNAGKKGGAQ